MKGFSLNSVSGFATLAIILIFAGVLIRSIYRVLRALREKRTDNQAPVCTFRARVKSKRTEERDRGTNFMGVSAVCKVYFASFKGENGQEIELEIPSPDYERLEEGQEGELSYQGQRYLSFE